MSLERLAFMYGAMDFNFVKLCATDGFYLANEVFIAWLVRDFRRYTFG
jgi:hypothetical protein